jgi:hypothetical protein
MDMIMASEKGEQRPSSHDSAANLMSLKGAPKTYLLFKKGQCMGISLQYGCFASALSTGVDGAMEL